MKIEVNCEQCGKRLRAPEGAAGRTARCPSCSARVHFPQAEARSDAARAQSARAGQALRGRREAGSAVVADKPRQATGRQAPAARPPARACPQCEAALASDALLCTRCGFDFRTGAPTPGVDQAAARVSAPYGVAPSPRSGAAWPTADDRRTDSVTGRALCFEGRFTPAVRPLEGERLGATVDASLWDLGLVGWLLGYKRRIVVTDRRVFLFEKRVFDNLLRVVWLPSVKLVAIGQALHVLMAAVALLIMLGGAGLAVVGAAAGPLGTLPGLGGALLGFVLLQFSRRKVIEISTGDAKLTLALKRMRPQESERVLQAVFSALNEQRIPGARGSAGA